MKNEAEANAEADRKAKEEIDKLNSADSMIFTTEKQLREFGDKIPAEKKTVIESALAELKAAHASKNISGIEASLEKLNNAWAAASQDMYQNQGSENPGDANAAQNPGGNAQATDVDFEEVKEDGK